jgi:hypothetical protein
MAKPKRAGLAAIIALACASALAAPHAHRSTAARHAFVRTHPCPATQLPRLPCPGWIIDHIVPLCLGGPDRPTNMQWQTRRDSLIKDASERRACQKSR